MHHRRIRYIGYRLTHTHEIACYNSSDSSTTLMLWLTICAIASYWSWKGARRRRKETFTRVKVIRRFSLVSTDSIILSSHRFHPVSCRVYLKIMPFHDTMGTYRHQRSSSISMTYLYIVCNAVFAWFQRTHRNTHGDHGISIPLYQILLENLEATFPIVNNVLINEGVPSYVKHPHNSW